MTDIVNIVMANLIMVGCFLIPLFLTRVADILLGVSLARKESIEFSWKKFCWGLWHSFCMLTGLASFISGISMIIPLIEYYSVSLDEDMVVALNGINTTAVILLIVGATVLTYGKDCFAKFKQSIGK